MRGIARRASPPRKVRLPITPAVLRAIHTCWSQSPLTYDRIMLWAAFCLAFFAFLRAGEFTCPSLSAFDPAIMLVATDVQVDSHTSPRSLTIRLKRSKCDPFGLGVLVHVGRTFGRLCPVAALLSYLAIRSADPGPLFVFEDGSSLSRQRLVVEMADGLRESGIDPTGYKGHSFRIGAATTAAQAGLPDSLIQTLGRWKSSAFTRYIRTPVGALCAASTSLSCQ